ncbi:MAG: ribose-5-phosphate isomerase [Clostridium sp.]|uniref:ribose-5-phosphate isomerase n=1 Tax=Clostridium sp. TaxID=1506 RepID=UPI0039E84DA0
MKINSKYEKIIEFVCDYKNISQDELLKILKDRDCKYILLLLLKKYKCIDLDVINSYFPDYSKKSLNYGLKKAKEKFFINKEFRDEYFEIEDDIKKSL